MTALCGRSHLFEENVVIVGTPIVLRRECKYFWKEYGQGCKIRKGRFVQF